VRCDEEARWRYTTAPTLTSVSLASSLPTVAVAYACGRCGSRGVTFAKVASNYEPEHHAATVLLLISTQTGSARVCAC
jgi:hypothetical protein